MKAIEIFGTEVAPQVRKAVADRPRRRSMRGLARASAGTYMHAMTKPSPYSISRPSSKAARPPNRCPTLADLARLAERLGFVRYWLAEHHNMPGIASRGNSSVVIGHCRRRDPSDDPR